MSVGSLLGFCLGSVCCLGVRGLLCSLRQAIPSVVLTGTAGDLMFGGAAVGVGLESFGKFGRFRVGLDTSFRAFTKSAVFPPFAGVEVDWLEGAVDA